MVIDLSEVQKSSLQLLQTKQYCRLSPQHFVSIYNKPEWWLSSLHRWFNLIISNGICNRAKVVSLCNFNHLNQCWKLSRLLINTSFQTWTINYYSPCERVSVSDFNFWILMGRIDTQDRVQFLMHPYQKWLHFESVLPWCKSLPKQLKEGFKAQTISQLQLLSTNYSQHNPETNY